MEKLKKRTFCVNLISRKAASCFTRKNNETLSQAEAKKKKNLPITNAFTVCLYSPAVVAKTDAYNSFNLKRTALLEFVKILSLTTLLHV